MTRNDRFRPLPRVATDDAIELRCWTGCRLFDNKATLFTGGIFKADMAKKLLGGQLEVLDVRQNVWREFCHTLIKARNGHAAIVVMNGR